MQLKRYQNNALKLICGAAKTSPVPAIQMYAHRQPIEGQTPNHGHKPSHIMDEKVIQNQHFENPNKSSLSNISESLNPIVTFYSTIHPTN